jgi:predicted metal-binding membrane protein
MSHLTRRATLLTVGEGPLPTMAFVLGFLVVWTAIGLVPLAVFLAFRNLSIEAAESSWLSIVAGGVLVGAGLYQFTPLKGVCLKACRERILRL